MFLMFQSSLSNFPMARFKSLGFFSSRALAAAASAASLLLFSADPENLASIALKRSSFLMDRRSPGSPERRLESYRQRTNVNQGN